MSPKVPMTERSDMSNIHQMMGPATPMTPMTPGSADPTILPQLQYKFKYIFSVISFKN